MPEPEESVDSRPAALREWLKGGQACCPSCGHGLRGLDVGVCPECGNALRVEVRAGPEPVVVSYRDERRVPVVLDIPVLWDERR